MTQANTTSAPATAPLVILMAVPRYPPPVVGGLEKQAHELASELVRRGHRVMALSGRIVDDQADVDTVDGVEIHRVGSGRNRVWRWMSWPISLWRRARQILKTVDVVHIHVFSGFGLFFIVLARLYRKPVLVKLPNVGIDGLPGLARGPLGTLRIWLFSKADAVVAMTPQSMAELADIGYAASRVLATPNGILIGPRRERPSLAAAQSCRFVFVGRLSEQKDIPRLLEAVKTLVDGFECGPFVVDLMGEGPLEAEVDRLIGSLGLSHHVRLLGHVENVAEHLPGYDAFVMPSLREGNSNAILEAMVAALPVISTRVGGTPMLVGREGADWLHEPGDSAALALIMHRAITDPRARVARGEAMRRRAEERFDMRQVVTTYVRAYEMLASGCGAEVSRASSPVLMGEG